MFDPGDIILQIMFMIAMAANYQRIKMSKEITDYRDAVDLELSDPRTMSTGNSKLSLS